MLFAYEEEKNWPNKLIWIILVVEYTIYNTYYNINRYLLLLATHLLDSARVGHVVPLVVLHPPLGHSMQLRVAAPRQVCRRLLLLMEKVRWSLCARKGTLCIVV